MKSLLQAPLKLNLQFFADEGGDQGQSGNDGDTGNSGDNGQDNQGGKEGDSGSDDGDDDKQFSRSDFRKMFGSQMNDFKKNELPGLLKDAEDKGFNRAKMSEDERVAADTKEREDKLNKRESALNQRDALTDTKNLLSKDGLPTDFAGMLSNLDETKRAENVANFKKMYKESVQNGVIERTKGGKTPKTGGSEHTDDPGLRYAELANKQAQSSAKDPWARNN